jgi:hypothetical protein
MSMSIFELSRLLAATEVRDAEPDEIDWLVQSWFVGGGR